MTTLLYQVFDGSPNMSAPKNAIQDSTEKLGDP